MTHPDVCRINADLLAACEAAQEALSALEADYIGLGDRIVTRLVWDRDLTLLASQLGEAIANARAVLDTDSGVC